MIIRDKDKEMLKLFFQQTPTPIEVWAYGSRVDGSAHEASDLDLVLRTKDLAPIDYAEFDALVYRIRESNIPILVELRDWALLPESFKKEIERNYEILYSDIQQMINL